MCSNCSGDDLKPESFATFDVSSPNREPIFAADSDAKRRLYRTSRILATLTKAALKQAILRWWQGAPGAAIIRNVDRPSFVNLNSPAVANARARQTRNSARPRELVEIRVSAAAIIEVFATPEAADRDRGEFSLSEGNYLSPWEESFAERTDLQRTLNRFRRARQLKYFAAYGTLLSCAAMIIWYALS